jgi:hypothetical protein
LAEWAEGAAARWLRCRDASRSKYGLFAAQKEKGPTVVGPVWDKLFCDRPGPYDPGGLGAEESGIIRTEPTQYQTLSIQKGGRLAEVGRYYDSSNDPVTL